MDLRIPEETPRYQWHGQPLPDPRYQWHGPTNPALVEARRQHARNSQELAISNAKSQKKSHLLQNALTKINHSNPLLLVVQI